MATTNGRISKDDLRETFAALGDEVPGSVPGAKPVKFGALGAVVAGALATVFLIGRRKGSKHATVVEVRRS